MLWRQSGWRCVEAPGGDANAADCHSAPGRPSGGTPGRPTTPAPPLSPPPKASCGSMCARGSPTGRSTRSPQPTCAAGKPNWPGTLGVNARPLPLAGAPHLPVRHGRRRDRRQPVHKVPPLKRRVDPEQIFTEAKRRALTPEEAGRLLAASAVLVGPYPHLLGTGLRFGELAGLRRRRVHLNRPIEPCRITLSFTRWPLALLLGKPRACPQSPPRPGTLTCAGT